VWDLDHWLVSVDFPQSDISDVDLIVPKDNIWGLHGGSIGVANKRFSILKDADFSFAPYEMVRYRDKKAVMRLGSFLRVNGPSIQIEVAPGKREFFPRAKVFKQISDRAPSNPVFAPVFLDRVKPIDPSDEITREFLDAGARISSLPDFSKKTPLDQLNVLAQFVARSLNWTVVAKRIEEYGLRSFNDILLAGEGVCRHNAILLAALLSEAGINARVVNHYFKDEDLGHAWVEADIEVNGKGETFVLDASVNKGFAIPMWRVKQVSAEYPKSFVAKWWASRTVGVGEVLALCVFVPQNPWQR
jgi:hypothetical protein